MSTPKFMMRICRSYFWGNMWNAVTQGCGSLPRVASNIIYLSVSVIVSSAVSQPRKKKMAPTTGISKRIDRGNGGGSSDSLLHNGRPVPLPQSSIVSSVVSKDLKRKIHSRLASEPCAKLVPSSSSGTAAGDFCARINEEGLVFLEPPNKYKVRKNQQVPRTSAPRNNIKYVLRELVVVDGRTNCRGRFTPEN